MATSAETKQGFQIFRAKEAPELMEAKCMSIDPISDVQRAGVNKALAAGYGEGDDIQVLVNMPGFSLTHAWMKKDYPLPLHSHDSDCMYYVVAGSVRVGTEELGPRDCFFVPANVPYTHKPGPNGVEILEIRHATEFNFVNLAKTAAYWDKATETVAANVETWKTAKRPSSVGQD